MRVSSFKMRRGQKRRFSETDVALDRANLNSQVEISAGKKNFIICFIEFFVIVLAIFTCKGSSETFQGPALFESKYFTVVKFDKSSQKVDAKCLNCQEIVKGSSLSTGNLRSHLKRNHTSLFNEIYSGDPPQAKLKQPTLGFYTPKPDAVINYIRKRAASTNFNIIFFLLPTGKQSDIEFHT